MLCPVFFCFVFINTEFGHYLKMKKKISPTKSNYKWANREKEATRLKNNSLTKLNVLSVVLMHLQWFFTCDEKLPLVILLKWECQRGIKKRFDFSWFAVVTANRILTIKNAEITSDNRHRTTKNDDSKQSVTVTAAAQRQQHNTDTVYGKKNKQTNTTSKTKFIYIYLFQFLLYSAVRLLWLRRELSVS